MENASPKNPDKSEAKVIIVTNLTRNVVEAHLNIIFGFYGQITKIDLPLYGKCESINQLPISYARVTHRRKAGQNRGKAALEFADSPSAHKAASHMDGGQLDGSILKVELSELPIRSSSRSRPISSASPRSLMPCSCGARERPPLR